MSSRYRNASYQDEINSDVEEHVLNEPEVIENLDPEENTYKKRYGDLRRYEQEQKVAFEKRISALEASLRETANATKALPKTRAELETWMETYPDVAGMIKTMIGLEAETSGQVVATTRQEVEDLKRKLEAEKALAALLVLHPDFMQIRADPAFHDWASKKSKRVQDALYENDTDTQAAAEVVDLYKAELSKSNKQAAPAPRASNGAATAVRAPSVSAPAGDSQNKWSESRVSSLSERDFNKFSDEIDEAIAAGKFVYDISGAAR